MLGFGAISELPLSTTPEVSADTHTGACNISATSSISAAPSVQIPVSSSMSATSSVSQAEVSLEIPSASILAGPASTSMGAIVEIDINGRNRDSSGDTWDIGAHEFVADTTAGAAFIMFVD